MPQTTNRNTALLWAALFAVVIISSIWRPQAQAQQGGGATWEYAIITFRAHDAVLFTSDNSYFMEGPEIRNPERIVGETSLRLVRPIEVEHLTTLGMQGWEVIRPWGDGHSWLLRRGR